MSRKNYRQFFKDNYKKPDDSEKAIPHSNLLNDEPSLKRKSLPAFENASNIGEEKTDEIPEIVIQDVLHKECKMVIAGASKSFKSWSLMDLGLSIATGTPWWGLKCKKQRVLYINLELISGFFKKRIRSICKVKNINFPNNFSFWSLRAQCYDLSIIENVLKARCQDNVGFDVIIVDPIYKTYGDLQENCTGDMAHLMNKIESLADDLKASVIFAAHFSKGKQGDKESMDRISGSGVFGRDPDVILTLTQHEVENCYIVQSNLRYLSALPDFVVKWDHPLMTPAEEEDPRRFFGMPEQIEKKNEVQTFSDQDVLGCLEISGMTDLTWRRTVSDKFGRGAKGFYDSKSQLITSGEVRKEGMKYFKVNACLDENWCMSLGAIVY